MIWQRPVRDPKSVWRKLGRREQRKVFEGLKSDYNLVAMTFPQHVSGLKRLEDDP